MPTRLTTLKSVHDAAMNDPKITKTAKVNIDARLMSAYLATNNSQGAQAIANEIKQLDPSSTLPGRVLGNTYLKMGVDAATAAAVRRGVQELRSGGRTRRSARWRSQPTCKPRS